MKSAVFFLTVLILLNSCAVESQLVLCSSGNGVTDIDGNQYATFVIGNQEWMAENLRTTSYANGEPIPQDLTPSGNGLTSGAWSWYDNDSQYENPYGKLYNWYAASDSRNVCPSGWHLPNDSEWDAFVYVLDSSADTSCYGNCTPSEIAGRMMKSTGTTYWSPYTDEGTNEACFNGLPAGHKGSGNGYTQLQTFGYWWSLTQWDELRAHMWELRFDQNEVHRWATPYKYSGRSIRCIKD